MKNSTDSSTTPSPPPQAPKRGTDRVAVVAIAAAGAATMLAMWHAPHAKVRQPASHPVAYQPGAMQASGVLLPPVRSTRAPDGPSAGGYGWDGSPAPQARDHARQTEAFSAWVQKFQRDLSTLDKQGLKSEADQFRIWFHAYLSHEATRCLAGEGPPAEVSPLFESPSVKRLLSPPPTPAFQLFYGYKVVLPWNHAVYYYRGDQIAPGAPYLLHEKGIADSGSAARTHEGIAGLFREAGIHDPVVQSVLLRVSAREGGFDAVNTWDTGYVSVGFLQFTTGEGASGHSLIRVLQRMKDAERGADGGEFKRFFSSHGIDVKAGELYVRDPYSGEIKTSKEAVRLIIDDKRLIAIFQDAGRKSRAFKIAQIREAYGSYYLASKFFRIPVTEIQIQVEGQPVRKRYVYGDEALRIAAEDAASAATVSASSEPPAVSSQPMDTPDETAAPPQPKRTVRRLPDLIARYSDVLYSEGGKVALIDRAVQRGVKNARETFLITLADVAEGLPPDLKAIRTRQDHIIEGLQNRIDVLRPEGSNPAVASTR